MHILQKVNSKQGRNRLPHCLVLSPTSELAQQIADVLSDPWRPCGLKTVCLYGGTSKEKQISSLKSGIVLDEADRMLDMGFEPEVRAIVSQTNSKRPTVMFSATWPLPVHQLAQEFMDPNPVKVVVGSEDLAANHDVMQIVEVLDDRSRDARLVALLEKYPQSQRKQGFGICVVFVLYKKEASQVEIMLQKRGWKAVSVHGDKAQAQRTNALSLFKEGKCPLMGELERRALRTLSLRRKIRGLLVRLREAGQVIPQALLKFGTNVKKKESKLYGSHFKEVAAEDS